MINIILTELATLTGQPGHCRRGIQLFPRCCYGRDYGHGSRLVLIEQRNENERT